MRSVLANTAAIATLMAFLLLTWIWREGRDTVAAPRYQNPLYGRLLELPAARGLDLSFLRTVTEDRVGPGPLANPLFEAPPHSYDVILFGDSTLAWGTLPQVVAQRAGLEVGLFAYESNFLNRRMVPIYDAIARTYLKPGGLAVFSFAAWTQVADPDLIRLYQTDFARIASVIASGGLPGPLARGAAQRSSSVLSAANIEAWRHRLRLRIFGVAQRDDSALPPLPALPALDTPSPSAPPAGLLDIDAMHPRFLRADASAVSVMVDAAAALRSTASTEPSVYRHLAEVVTDTVSRAQLETNAAAFRALAAAAPYRVVLMTPIYAAAERGSYLWQRAVYRLVYAQQFCLLDLGALHPADITLPVGKEGHVVNEGGLLKSVLIGAALAAGKFECPAPADGRP
jgi:hypothetical protein